MLRTAPAALPPQAMRLPRAGTLIDACTGLARLVDGCPAPPATSSFQATTRRCRIGARHPTWVQSPGSACAAAPAIAIPNRPCSGPSAIGPPLSWPSVPLRACFPAIFPCGTCLRCVPACFAACCPACFPACFPAVLPCAASLRSFPARFPARSRWLPARVHRDVGPQRLLLPTRNAPKNGITAARPTSPAQLAARQSNFLKPLIR